MVLRPHLDQPGGEGGGGQGGEREGEEETRAELQKGSRSKSSPAYFLTFCAMWRKQNAPKSSNAINYQQNSIEASFSAFCNSGGRRGVGGTS